ncbi:P-loop containing nucleoside triphosphate hydrolase protein [Biscogniauxia sp. FL1348]|nr:P-loop containing nucleoside triphosphate hydrolase protein [Biscogniauxia sp. FL1348]
MPRYIDTVPTPAHVEPKKLIVLSAPRTGTHGLYLALKKLGFKPYHMVEVMDAGPAAMQTLLDGFDAEFLHVGKPYGRAEFDKWFAKYDIIIEMPFFMIHSIVKAYPDAKFLLVERNPEKWATSYINTVGQMERHSSTFPFWILSYLDDYASKSAELGRRMTRYCTNGYGITPEGRASLVENYKDYIAEVKRIVPPEQLKVCKLEDGFGWEQVCPYIGVPVPDMDWPSLNTPDEFHSLVRPRMQAAARKGLIKIASMAVPLVAAGIWFAKNRGLPQLS